MAKKTKKQSSGKKPAKKAHPAKASKAQEPAKKAAKKPVFTPMKKTTKLSAKDIKAAKEAAAKIEIPPPKPIFKSKQLNEYKDVLQRLRDRVVDEISFLAGDNLNRSQRESSGDLSSYSFHMADQGTDNFDREFALNLVSSEQDVLYEIDEALNRISMKTYGVCEACGKAIEKARLKALPFAKMCIKCKSAAEKGKSRFRPFGPTLSQTPQTE